MAKLTAPIADVWVASAGQDPPAAHLVPLSLAWVDDQAVIAVHKDSRTARDITGNRAARLAVGPTRDVVMLDVHLERVVPVAEPEGQALGERYVTQADWDPRTSAGYVFLVLQPHRVQAWREVDEMPGRTLMRDGAWLA